MIFTISGTIEMITHNKLLAQNFAFVCYTVLYLKWDQSKIII